VTCRHRPAVDWPLLRLQVIQRDAERLLQKFGTPGETLAHFMARSPRPIVCIAPIVDPRCGPCWGRTTLDHVKKEPRMGVKAEDRLDRLVSVCQGHSEDGRKAGYQWNTAHRAEERAYLDGSDRD